MLKKVGLPSAPCIITPVGTCYGFPFHHLTPACHSTRPQARDYFQKPETCEWLVVLGDAEFISAEVLHRCLGKGRGCVLMTRYTDVIGDGVAGITSLNVKPLNSEGKSDSVL